MAGITQCPGRRSAPLRTAWQLASTPPNAIAGPGDLTEGLAWIAADVPGTVAAARLKAGLFSPAAPQSFDAEDHWFRTRFRASGAQTLRFHGLATLATVWLNGREILASQSMFVSHDVAVQLAGDNELVICFRSQAQALSGTHAAGRWRPRMIQPAALRHYRTTVLGHMPGWCPGIETVGPWRGIELVQGLAAMLSASVRARLDGDTGILDVEISAKGRAGRDIPAEMTVSCAGSTAALSLARDGGASARLEVPGVARWWPHTHGEPVLHDVTLACNGETFSLGRVGFRTIEVDRGTDGRGFGVKVNGCAVFCRGAVWASADLMSQPEDAAAIRPWLVSARDAGMNMLRVPGTTVYEADAFYALCDELGMLVWQDFMFANFDYPAADETFLGLVKAEARQFLLRTETSPSLAVLCGGSEVYQQAAMLGLPPRKYLNPIFEAHLPELVAAHRPDVPYVAGSPSGGALPFVVNEGVGHYFGVGAYKRPLSDARHAQVRFASECLAFANVPAEIATPHHEPPLTDIADPRWQSRIPRDIGATWNFEDVREHYLAEMFAVSPARLRYEDPERYLELSRAVQGSVMEATFNEWMRPEAPTRGGLVLMLQDLQPGAGWGLISSCGTPKSPYYALKRAFRPVRVTLTDEGVNGLGVHVANETGEARAVTLRLTAWRDGRTQVLQAEKAFPLAPRAQETHSAYALIGSFFDISYAYRFQAPQHDAVVASLADTATGETISEAFHFPLGHAGGAVGAVPEASLSVSLEHSADAWWLCLAAERIARFVHIVDPNFLPEDDWFHLAPKSPRRIRLVPRRGAANGADPKGRVRALNLPSSLTYAAAP